MKQAIICILCNLTCSLLHAQFNIGQSANQQLIGEAVKNGVLLVRQEYRLQDVENQKIFGRQDQKYFGIVYSLALKLNGEYAGEGKIIKPWQFDSNYQKYANDKQYKPVISKTQYRKIGNAVFEELTFDTARVTPVVPDYLYTWPDAKGEFGFQPDNTPGIKKGWLIWLTLDKEIQHQDTATVDLEIYRTEINVTADSVFYEIKNPNITKSIIGGFYVVPVMPRIGQITFNLVGILHLIDNKWNIVTFASAKATEDNKNDLTPVTEK